MQLSDTLIKELLQQSFDMPFPADTYLLSAYIPFAKQTKQDIENTFRSLFETQAHQYIQSKSPDNKIADICNNLLAHIDTEEVGQKGIALFSAMDLSEHALNTDKAYDFISTTIIQLPLAPKQSIFLGNIYDVRQLIQIQQQVFQALVIQLSIADYWVYSMNLERIEELVHVDASVSLEPSHTDDGKRGIQSKEDHKKQTSLNDSIKEAFHKSKQFLSQIHPEYVICIHSKQFSSELIEKHFKEAFSDIPQIRFHSEIGHTPFPQLYPSVADTILEDIKNHILQEIRSIKENPNFFSEDPEKIAAWIGAKNAEILFIAESQMTGMAEIVLLLQLIYEAVQINCKVMFIPDDFIQKKMLLKLRYKESQE